ncbi:MAG: efflux RND transporter permease subunit [Planctomycetaceae bacterium]|nr:efflux RND transporter permease subunit [Planctomycetaceae bacterium]
MPSSRSFSGPGHRPTEEYVRRLRLRLNRAFPGVTFYFLPADIVSQTINFGLPAPFDVQIVGRDQQQNRAVAGRLAEKLRRVPGVADVRVQQPADLPRLQFAVDRVKASELGLTQRDVANAMLLSLSGSSQVQPMYWLNPKKGVQYLVNVRTPQHAMDSLSALNVIPAGIGQPGRGDAQVLANLATLRRSTGPPIVNHYNVMPVIDVLAGTNGRDLGGVLRDIRPLVAEAEKELTKGNFIVLRGQAQTMDSSFLGLGLGLIVATALIYLLLVVNFQSWLDPFIILTALPGALAGVVWGLYLTYTTLNVPALMGAIMSLGAGANGEAARLRLRSPVPRTRRRARPQRPSADPREAERVLPRAIGPHRRRDLRRFAYPAHRTRSRQFTRPYTRRKLRTGEIRRGRGGPAPDSAGQHPAVPRRRSAGGRGPARRYGRTPLGEAGP